MHNRRAEWKRSRAARSFGAQFVAAGIDCGVIVNHAALRPDTFSKSVPVSDLRLRSGTLCTVNRNCILRGKSEPRRIPVSGHTSRNKPQSDDANQRKLPRPSRGLCQNGGLRRVGRSPGSLFHPHRQVFRLQRNRRQPTRALARFSPLRLRLCSSPLLPRVIIPSLLPRIGGVGGREAG